jgi:hypothetical protein
MVLPLSGCKVYNDSLVIHDELFTYDVVYDKAYLLILDAVNETEGWRLSGMDKRTGTISAFNDKFMNDDVVTIIVKRIARGKTSVELSPESQGIKGVDVLLKAIDKKMMS